MIINKESYHEKLNYDMVKTGFKRFIYNGIDTSILEKSRKDYYLMELNELANTIQNTFNLVESFGSGKDSFIIEFTNIIANQYLINLDIQKRIRKESKRKKDDFLFIKYPRYGSFYWNFKSNILQHFSIGFTPHVTNNKFTDCREFDYIFDLSILCSKIIAVYSPNLVRDLKVLNSL